MYSALSLAAVLIVSSPQTPARAAIDLAWLSGCWEMSRNGRHVIEQWTPAEGNTLLGVSRTVVDGKTTEYEFVIIRKGANGLEYVAKPSGQAEAAFAATRISATEAVFENPQHDFPTRIVYTRDGETLLAAVEGPSAGRTRRIEYPYTRASCGGR